MTTVAVTGGCRGGGAAVVHELRSHGYEVRVLDRVAQSGDIVDQARVDLTDYDATVRAMEGFDAVVHFAADAEPDRDFSTAADRFRNNTLSTYNVFNAAARLGLRRVVWASSETVFGYPFRGEIVPAYLPIDDRHPLRPQSGYAMSKVLCEQLARDMAGRHDISIVGLRLSNILHTSPKHPASYVHVPSYWSDLRLRSENLWGYIDARDAAASARLALEANIQGADEFIIAAADSIMNTPSKELATRVFAAAHYVGRDDSYHSLLSSRKAAEKLGFVPRYSWRDVIDPSHWP